MSTTVSSYGAIELARMAHRFWLTGLVISVALHGIGLGVIFTLTSAAEIRSRSGLPTRPIQIYDPTPPGFGLARPRGSATPGRVRLKANPVPVPEEHIPRDTDFAMVGWLPGGGDPEGVPLGTPDQGESSGAIVIPDTAPPPFVPYEKPPLVVRSVPPAYPLTALRSGVEGNVVVSIWVDVRGGVRQVKVLSSSNDAFNEPATEAAKQFVFTPAIMNDRAVAVWVSVPFRFRIVDARK